MAESLKHKTIRGLFWSVIEKFSTLGLNFIFSIILARLLQPSDYGVIAMVSIFMAIAQTFIDSGFSNALIRKLDRTEVDNSTTLYFNVIVGLVCYLLLFISAPYIADFYDTPVLKYIIRVVCISLIFNSFSVVQQAILTINIDFKLQAKISLISSFISGIVGIVFALSGFGVWALVFQIVITYFIRMLLLWVFVRWIPRRSFSYKSFKELFSYGSKLLASGLLDTVYNNVYTIVIGKYFTASQLGFYSRADSLAQMPSSIATGVFQRVTFPVLSTIQNENDKLVVNYRKMLRASAFIIFPLMTGLSAVADPLIRIILTDKWSGAIIFLQIICFALMWYPVHAINLNLLQVKGRSDLFLRLEIIKKIIGVATLCVTIPLGLIAMCVGRIVTSLIALVINTYYTGKLINVGYFLQIKDLMPIFVNSLIMAIICYTVQIPFDSNWIKLLLALVIGVVYYFGINYILKSSELKELINIVRKK